jgi:hypothetical protein
MNGSPFSEKGLSSGGVFDEHVKPMDEMEPGFMFFTKKRNFGWLGVGSQELEVQARKADPKIHFLFVIDAGNTLHWSQRQRLSSILKLSLSWMWIPRSHSPFVLVFAMSQVKRCPRKHFPNTTNKNNLVTFDLPFLT